MPSARALQRTGPISSTSISAPTPTRPAPESGSFRGWAEANRESAHGTCLNDGTAYAARYLAEFRDYLNIADYWITNGGLTVKKLDGTTVPTETVRWHDVRPVLLCNLQAVFVVYCPRRARGLCREFCRDLRLGARLAGGNPAFHIGNGFRRDGRCAFRPVGHACDRRLAHP